MPDERGERNVPHQDSLRELIKGLSAESSTLKFEIARLEGEPVYVELSSELRTKYREFLGLRNKRLHSLISETQEWRDEDRKNWEKKSLLQRFFSMEPNTEDYEQRLRSERTEQRDLAAAIMEIEENRVDRLRRILCRGIEDSLLFSGLGRSPDVVGDNVARDAVLNGLECCDLLAPIDPDTTKKYRENFERRKPRIVPWYVSDSEAWWQEGREGLKLPPGTSGSDT